VSRADAFSKKGLCMDSKRSVVLRLAFIVALLGGMAPFAHAQTVRAAIEKANSEIGAAAAKGDAAQVAAMYATDAMVMPAGSEPIHGADAILKFWQSSLAGIGGVALKTVDLFEHGSMATEVGQYELRDKAGKTIDHGKYMVLWRKEGGKWKLFRDMFSTNVAPGG
jgi:ketosteroid isomerase-like protein